MAIEISKKSVRDALAVRHEPYWGPMLDVFRIDMRSYRGPNGENRQTTRTPETDFLGAAQLAWLKRELKASTTTWKVIAADMPLGLVVWHDWRQRRGSEAVANGDDEVPLGRELEIADLLSFIKRENVRNVVWLTADVHYCATHRYDPEKAAFDDFRVRGSRWRSESSEKRCPERTPHIVLPTLSQTTTVNAVMFKLLRDGRCARRA